MKLVESKPQKNKRDYQNQIYVIIDSIITELGRSPHRMLNRDRGQHFNSLRPGEVQVPLNWVIIDPGNVFRAYSTPRRIK